jgi:glycosyltransferase involved in cell wall biosynthesis
MVAPMGCVMVSPVITVLMPVRDTPTWMLRMAIDSVLNQSFAEFEFLIVDDGSSDGQTIACLADAARRPRVRIERTCGIGVTRALNRGLELARGHWIARHDGDDWSEPERFERQIRFVRENPRTVLCGTAAWNHQQDGSRLWVSKPPRAHLEILEALDRGNPFFHGSVVFSKSAAHAVGGYREELTCSQDYDFFWRLAENGETANLAEPLYHYRYRAGSVSAARAAEQARAHRAAKALAQARRRGIAENVELALRGDVSSLAVELKQADHLMLAGEYRRACRAYAGVLGRHRASPLAWAKALRLALFIAAPPLREMSFGQ